MSFLHLGHLSRKSYFILNLAFKVDHFYWDITSGSPFLNISYVLKAWSAPSYIVHNLERMTNNMGQTFRKEKHFHIHTTLSLSNYVIHINEVNK